MSKIDIQNEDLALRYRERQEQMRAISSSYYRSKVLTWIKAVSAVSVQQTQQRKQDLQRSYNCLAATNRELKPHDCPKIVNEVIDRRLAEAN